MSFIHFNRKCDKVYLKIIIIIPTVSFDLKIKKKQYNFARNKRERRAKHFHKNKIRTRNR